MYCLMVSAETVPVVAAKYERVHIEGNFLSDVYFLLGFEDHKPICTSMYRLVVSAEGAC